CLAYRMRFFIRGRALASSARLVAGQGPRPPGTQLLDATYVEPRAYNDERIDIVCVGVAYASGLCQRLLLFQEAHAAPRSFATAFDAGVRQECHEPEKERKPLEFGGGVEHRLCLQHLPAMLLEERGPFRRPEFEVGAALCEALAHSALQNVEQAGGDEID